MLYFGLIKNIYVKSILNCSWWYERVYE